MPKKNYKHRGNEISKRGKFVLKLIIFFVFDFILLLVWVILQYLSGLVFESLKLDNFDSKVLIILRILLAGITIYPILKEILRDFKNLFK